MFTYYPFLLNKFRVLVKLRGYKLSKEDKKAVKNHPGLFPGEINEIQTDMLKNTSYFISDEELQIMFKSFQHKRTHKKKKIKYEQLRWI